MTCALKLVFVGNSNAGSNNIGKEYVRQELRAKVDARIGGRVPQQMQIGSGPPVDLDSLGIYVEMPNAGR